MLLFFGFLLGALVFRRVDEKSTLRQIVRILLLRFVLLACSLTAFTELATEEAFRGVSEPSCSGGLRGTVPWSYGFNRARFLVKFSGILQLQSLLFHAKVSVWGWVGRGEGRRNYGIWKHGLLTVWARKRWLNVPRLLHALVKESTIFIRQLLPLNVVLKLLIWGKRTLKKLHFWLLCRTLRCLAHQSFMEWEIGTDILTALILFILLVERDID